MKMEGPHLMSLGGGRLSTAVTLLPLPSGESNFAIHQGFIMGPMLVYKVQSLHIVWLEGVTYLFIWMDGIFGNWMT